MFTYEYILCLNYKKIMNQLLTTHLSTVCAIGLIVIGLLLGFSDLHLPLRQMHLLMAILIIIMLPLILYVHIKRFYLKGAFDWIAWTHFLLFTIFIGLAIRMIRYWYPTMHTKTEDFKNDAHQLYWQGKPINHSKLRDFVNQHPGGIQMIEKIFNDKYHNQHLEDIWEQEGVSWHKKNPNVKRQLSQMVE